MMTPQKYYLSNKNGFKLNSNNGQNKTFISNKSEIKQSNKLFNINENNKQNNNER